MSAYIKDILRTIGKEKKRLIALMVITVLGVTMMTGLKAACDDLRLSADRFFDAQNLHDLTVLSTLGLTEDDVDALLTVDGVLAAEGQYSETVEVAAGEGMRSAEVKTFCADGIDVPYVVSGRLPENENEIAVTESYLEDAGRALGDTLELIEDTEEDSDAEDSDEVDAEDSDETEADNSSDSEDDEDDFSFDEMEDMEDLEEEDSPNFPHTKFTIVGTITDVTSVDNPEGSVSFRTSSDTDYTFYVTREAVESDYYTAVNLTVAGAKELLSFTDDYEELVERVETQIEEVIQEEREIARYDQLLQDAAAKILDAEDTMKDAFAEAEEKIRDARRELKKGKKELTDGEAELEKEAAEAAQKIADARQTIADGKAELAAGNLKLDDAERKLLESKKELASGEKELEEGEEKLASGEKELEENEKKLEAGEQQLAEGEAALADGEQELNGQETAAYAQMDAAQVTLTEKRAEVVANLAEQEANAAALSALLVLTGAEDEWSTLRSASESVYRGQLEAAAAETAAGNSTEDTSASESSIPDISGQVSVEITALAEAMGELYSEDYVSLAMALGYLDASLTVIDAQQAQLTAQREEAAAQFAAAHEEIDSNREILEQSKKELEEGRRQLTEGKASLASARETLESGRKELEEGRAEWEAGWKQVEEGRAEAKAAAKKLADGEAELNEQESEAEARIADARAEIADGWEELADGEAELEENIALYHEKKAEAEEKIADAWAELEDLEPASWYVRTRDDLGGYSDITSDADCIEAVGTAFPIMFFIVAILISLTTIARMVEENRGLIGTYQALGFTSAEIRRKYEVYITVAVLLGGLFGNLLGFIVLPEIIFIIFHTMYLLPSYLLSYNPLYGFGGTALFWAGILAAALLTCRATLQSMPAELMRPKTPKSGSRILLERFPGIWKRLSFLNKVTARNLFRYKKRFLMTVCGIAGCTGILLCGFAIKDTVTDLMPRQYDYINQYDILAVSSAGEDSEALLAALHGEGGEEALISESVADDIYLQISSVKLKNEDGESLSLQLYVVPEGETLDGYINLCNTDKVPLALSDDGVYVTENAARVLNFEAGDIVRIQDLDLNQAEGTVLSLVENYLGNSVFMTEACYRRLFGEIEKNAVLVHLTESADDSKVAESIANMEGVLSVSCTQELKDTFSTAFALINMVVYIVIVMAAALAFVVLFTLSTTNISERERELATIKVLGFFDPEVHRYVNKETLILTGIGILIGMPLGRILGEMLMMVLKLPSINFAVTLHKVSYLIAAVMSFGFALLVDAITNRVLDRIDPVEALKSVE